LKKKAGGLSPKEFGALESIRHVSFERPGELISAETAVRFRDVFLDRLNLDKLQFKVKELNFEGRPPFHPKLFLKIYL
jgi:hypothetical protein